MQTMQVLEDSNYIIILVTVFSMSALTRGDMDGNWATFKWRDKHFLILSMQERMFNNKPESKRYITIEMLNNKQQWRSHLF